MPLYTSIVELYRDALLSHVSLCGIRSKNNLAQAIAVIAYLVYRLIKDERILAPAARKNAEDILDDRYAKGELTREQYAQMKEDIKKAT
jgi:hypothetical protein